MFFLDKNGDIQEGLPLSEQTKQALDDMADFFHGREEVCGGYDHAYSKTCHVLAVAFLRRFDVIQKPDYVEVAKESEVEVMPAFTPEPVPAPADVVASDDIPF